MQDKITAPVCTLDVTDGETSGLGATLLKCQTIRSAPLSGARLKEFYCTLTDIDDNTKLHHNACVPTKIRMY
jgi:hypothetical protein